MPAQHVSQTEAKPRDLLVAGAVFVAVSAAVWWLWANRFFLSLDEGIYLAGAQRILRGQVPCRDFFVLTGPGTFWIEAFIMGLLGPTLRHARLMLVFDLALLSGVVYWLTARLTTRNFALTVTALFFALETRPLFRLYVNHRWDSSAFGLLAVVLVFAGTGHPRFRTFLAAGMVAAVAAWITPSLLAVALVLGIWLLFIKQLRWQCVPFLLGVVFVSVLAGGVLFFQGGLVPMLRDLLWTSSHYPPANRVPYGYGAIGAGGIRAIFSGAGGAALVARATGLISVLAPVVLPFIVYAGWMIRRFRGTEIDDREKLALLLVLASFGFVISTYPRWSADQLLFIAPIFYVLGAYLLSRVLTGKIIRVLMGALALALGIASLSYSIQHVLAEPIIQSRMGEIRAGSAEQSIIKLVSARVSPGDTLFAYPYFPMVYFLTGAQNPTSYSFLQPGMMQTPEYERTLATLKSHPPRWIFYFSIPLATYHGIWPAADPRALKLTPVDHFIIGRYHPVGMLQSSGTQFFLLEQGPH